MVRDHGFRSVRITRIIDDTADTRSYVLDAQFAYRAGQFITVRACGTLRSYSISSSPDTDSELMTTVKRVPGGLVSNWIHDNLGVGDLIEITRPAGVFCLRDSAGPMVAFCAGSGVTPVLSLAKSALATTGRRVRILYATRDAGSVIFAPALAGLAAEYPDRLEISHHLDTERGFVTADTVRSFAGEDFAGDFYLCGPAPFMDLTQRALTAHGVGAGHVLIERFEPTAGAPAGPPADPTAGLEREGNVTIVVAGQRRTVPRLSGETLLESARRASLTPPFSCEAGNCATCMARVTEGSAEMKTNNALDDDEVADGWVLTCQAEPATPHITVVYED
jgi:ferredoxin-NADP reductase